jgi:D-3-phosphoglycerate dehydrogenase
MIIKLLEPLNIEKELLEAFEVKCRENGHLFKYFDTVANTDEELINRAEQAEIIIIANRPISNEVIRALPRLKMISVAFTGIDHVGVEACNERKILICNAAGYSDISVSELTIGLTLSVLRSISVGDVLTKSSKTIGGFIGNELRGKTVGIVGLGRIGKEVAKLFSAFGCTLLGYDIDENHEPIQNIKYVDIDELMMVSDIVTLHFPFNKDTKKFISKQKLELMKETAVLINCARGGVVDNDALADLLNDGKIAGSGIDVFDMEPPIPNDYPLLKAKNTVLTPHVAYATKESMIKRADIVFDNVLSYINKHPKNVVKIN